PKVSTTSPVTPLTSSPNSRMLARKYSLSASHDPCRQCPGSASGSAVAVSGLAVALAAGEPAGGVAASVPQPTSTSVVDATRAVHAVLLIDGRIRSPQQATVSVPVLVDSGPPRWKSASSSSSPSRNCSA